MNNLTRSLTEYLDDQFHRYPRAFLMCAVVVGFAASEVIDRLL